MTFLYHDAGRYDGAVFAWLMGAFPAYCIMYVFSTLLTANGSLALLNKISVAGVIINISLNIWLIQTDLALGAAITACITQSILAICYILFSARIFRLKLDMKWLAAHLGFIALALGTGYSVQFIRAHWMLQMLALAVLCITYLFAFGFVSVSSIRKLKAQKQA
jgi:O-antigen/teichoic acid export membrane protein